MNSQVALFRNSIIEKFIKQCVKDDIQNIELPVNATHRQILRFFNHLTERFCGGDCFIDINNYIDVEGIDISLMFGDEDDIKKVWYDFVSPYESYAPYPSTIDKHELLIKYAFAFVSSVIDLNSQRLYGVSDYFGFGIAFTINEKYTILFDEEEEELEEEEEEHEECDDC